jgi:hypothetical protein
MSVFVSAWLFGKPEFELGSGEVTPQELRELAQEFPAPSRPAARASCPAAVWRRTSGAAP